MNEPISPVERVEDEQLHRSAVAALCEVARRAQPGTTGQRRGPDAAEVIASVITTVAADVGGVEVLLAGRSESWEADAVRQLVESTAGPDDTGLWRYRSAPVRLTLDTEAEFQRLGLTELFLDACDTVDAAWPLPDDPNGEVDPRAERAAEQLLDVVHRLFDADRAAYVAGYAEVVTAEVARLGRPDLPVQVEDGVVSEADRAVWVPILEALQLVADERTPLPPTGLPPDWTTGNPADAARAASHSYLDRARAEIAARGAS